MNGHEKPPGEEISLPEIIESEEEQSRQLEEIGRVTVEVIPRERMAELARESEAYARTSAHIDQEMAAQQQLQHLETGGRTKITSPDTPSQGRPPDVAIRRGQQFRMLSNTRRPTSSSAVLETIVKARVTETVRELRQVFTRTFTSEDSQARVERLVNTYGTSLDQYFRQQVALNDQLRTTEEAQQIAQAFADKDVSNETVLRALAEFDDAIRPGNKVDVAAAQRAAEQVLSALRTMLDALTTVGLEATSEYHTALAGVAAVVGGWLGQLGRGEPVSPRPLANRSSDLGRRLQFLEAQPGIKQRIDLEKARASRQQSDESITRSRDDIIKATSELDGLTTQDHALATERSGATRERQEEIDHQLRTNQGREAKLRSDIAQAKADITEKSRYLRRLEARVRALESALTNFSSELKAAMNRKLDSGSTWTVAIENARRSLRDSRLSSADQDALDSQLKTLKGDLDIRFRKLVRTIKSTNNESGQAVLEQGWEFARSLTLLQDTVSRLLDPGEPTSTAMAAARQSLQVTLAALAGTVAKYVLMRVGFTSSR